MPMIRLKSACGLPAAGEPKMTSLCPLSFDKNVLYEAASTMYKVLSVSLASLLSCWTSSGFREKLIRLPSNV